MAVFTICFLLVRIKIMNNVTTVSIWNNIMSTHKILSILLFLEICQSKEELHNCIGINAFNNNIYWCYNYVSKMISEKKQKHKIY